MGQWRHKTQNISCMEAWWDWITKRPEDYISYLDYQDKKCRYVPGLVDLTPLLYDPGLWQRWIVGPVVQSIDLMLERQTADINASIEDLGSDIEGILETMNRTFNRTFQFLESQLETIGQLVYTIETSIRNVVQGVTDWLDVTLAAMTEHLRDVIGLAVAGVLIAFELAKIAVKKLTEEINIALQSVIEWATDNFKTFYEEIRSGQQAMADAVVESIKAKIEWSKTLFDGAVEIAVTGIKMLGGAIKLSIETVGGIIKTLITTVGEIIEGSLTIISTTIIEVMNTMIEFFNSIFPEDAETLAKGLTMIVDAYQIVAERLSKEKGGLAPPPLAR